MNKEELSEKINELLGLQEDPIAFEKLAKDDMERLCEAVETLSLGGGILGKKLLNRPISDIMNMRLRDVFKEIRGGDKEGPLGLGLISLIFEERGKR